MVLSCNVVEVEELGRSSGVWMRERLPGTNAARLGGTLAGEVAEDGAATMRAWYSGKIRRGKEGSGFARGTSEPAVATVGVDTHGWGLAKPAE
jgi:hypothetical protein